MMTGWCLQILRQVVLVMVVVVGSLSCPDTCHCRQDDSESQQYVVICDGQLLTAIPIGLPLNITKLSLSDNKISNLSLLQPMPMLQELDLSNNRITRLDENVFRNFPNLTRLSLQLNQIRDIRQGSFQDLNQLRQLDLAQNNINILDSKSFFGLKLRKLNISHNYIQMVENGTFHNDSDIRVLDLSYNPMVSLTNASFKELHNLRNLRLSGCDLTDLSELHPSPTLEHLDLSNNSIPHLDKATFPALARLSYLNLDGNNISFIAQGTFCSMPALKIFTMNNNPINSLGTDSFSCLESLQSLSISCLPNLHYLHSKVFHGLVNLKTLALRHSHQLEYLHVNTFQNVNELQHLDLSYNGLRRINQRTLSHFKHNIDIDVHGNNFICECGIEWLLHLVSNNASKGDKSVINFVNKENINCSFENSTKSIPLLDVNVQNIVCDNVSISTASKSLVSYKIGSSAVFRCDFSGYPPPSVTWITPRQQYFHFHNSHPLAVVEYPTSHSVSGNGTFHKRHQWHKSSQYQHDLQDSSDRITLLDDGSLYIDYILRSDAGPYQCVVENPVSKHSIMITLRLDYSVITEVKIMSLFIGLACAVSFFMLNLIYAFVLALARRCIKLRRREAIVQLVENLDAYKSTQMAKLRENYNSQLNRIRDTYHQRLERIRDNYTTQMSRLSKGASHLREGASHKVDTIRGNYKTIRENYHNQLTKLREYSSHQMEQLREMYSNQVLKVRDYGSTQLGRFHHKYKLQQQHLMKLLEMMNMDNCRTVFETECVRAESMILETDFNVQSDVTIPSPVDSVSVVSDSEYVTASSAESSPHSSCEVLSTIHVNCEESTGTDTGSYNHATDSENKSTSSIQSRDDNQQTDNDSTCVNLENDENERFLQTGDTSSHVQIQMIDDSDDGIDDTDGELDHENEIYV